MTVKAFRVVTDEPQGVCVGFKPAGPESDRFIVEDDDGGRYVFINDDGIRMMIRKRRQNKSPEEGWPEWPEPDLMVWRTRADFLAWWREEKDL